VVLGGDSPDADFVVLVCGEELVGVDYYGLHSTFSRGYDVGVWWVFGEEKGVVP